MQRAGNTESPITAVREETLPPMARIKESATEAACFDSNKRMTDDRTAISKHEEQARSMSQEDASQRRRKRAYTKMTEAMKTQIPIEYLGTRERRQRPPQRWLFLNGAQR